jgi:peptidoglycan glycosyltransferase
LKLLSKRAVLVFILSLLLVLGAFAFVINYLANGSSWVQYPYNKHLYTDGEMTRAGTIYDRNGEILAQTVDGKRVFNENKTVRKAVMHAVGDLGGNVATGAQVAFGQRLSGWNLLSGVYRFQQAYNPGMDLTLTLDADLCAAAYKALGGQKGAVGIYNYKTGEILCMVSSPSFDPKNPPDIEAKPETYEGVYINRLLSAAYTPGSVFKLVTAAAAIDKLSNIDTKSYHCEGEMEIGGVMLTCPSAHGDVTLEQALAESCNIAFAQITLELGADTLQKYAEKAGFNSSLTVDGIRTAVSTIDVVDAEDADLAWAGVGQYSDTANPLNMMAYVGAIANGGVRVTPRLIADDGMLSGIASSVGRKTRILSADTAEKLGAMMRNDVVSNYGEYNYSGLELCAKSGTAEVGGGKAPNAWFVGFLNREDCPLAFVVIIENGGAGSKVAGPVAAKALKAAVSSMTGD